MMMFNQPPVQQTMKINNPDGSTTVISMMNPPQEPPPMYNPFQAQQLMYNMPFYPQQQQQQQPNVVFVQNEPPEKKPEEKPKEISEAEKKAEKEKKEKAEAEKKKKADAEKKKKEEEDKKKAEEEDKKRYPLRFSRFSIVSVVVFALALLAGSAAMQQTYVLRGEREDDAPDAWIDDGDGGRVTRRETSVALGFASVVCFTAATLCSFFAGTRHLTKAKLKQANCGQDGFVIASWIVFILSSILDLIILIMSFDEANPPYPDVVVVGFIGSIVSWLLMFGYSEMTRRW